MNRTLVYFHDPMCSWCYGYKPILKKLIKILPKDIEFKQVLGGLAKDTNEPMPKDMQLRLQTNWRAIIKKMPNTEFNFDFWTLCQPYRATYMACRAVIATRILAPEKENNMIEQIQTAYYREARNPSLIQTLIECSEKIGLNTQGFEKQLKSPHTEQVFMDDLKICGEFGVTSFPTLVLKIGNNTWHISIDYNDEQISLEEIEVISNMNS